MFSSNWTEEGSEINNKFTDKYQNDISLLVHTIKIIPSDSEWFMFIIIRVFIGNLWMFQLNYQSSSLGVWFSITILLLDFPETVTINMKLKLQFECQIVAKKIAKIAHFCIHKVVLYYKRPQKRIPKQNQGPCYKPSQDRCW